MPASDHQLAAVLFSDIEGYTSMIQEDEQSAIETVNRYQKELEKTVLSFNGEVKQQYGDGSLTIFPSAADAVACAYSLQKNLQGSIPLRIGIHYGNVVSHSQKIFGDTVNIASRIESLGQPGTVLFSGDVFREIKPETRFKAVSMGNYRFKNVNREIEVFALANEGLKLPKAGSLKGKLEPKKSAKWPFIIAGLLGVFLVLLLVLNGIRGPVPEDGILRGSLNPSIAILPFDNLSADSAQEYFAEGLAQEVLTLLTKDTQLRVTSRSSSFSFKDQQLGIPEIAEKLGVQYVLDGSVQQAGNSVRINVQLIDAQNDDQLWAQSWGRSLGDIFAVQQEIADSVKAALKVQILTDRNRNLPPTNAQAYNLFLQARHIGQQGSVDGLKNAEKMVREVLTIDSAYASGWALLSAVLNRQSNIGMRTASEGQELARQAAFRALDLDSTMSTAWSVLTNISIYYDRDFRNAQYYMERARKIEPGGLGALKLASNLAFCQGNIDQAIALDQESIAIDPVSPKSHLDLGYGYFYKGQYEEAEKVTRQGLLMNPGYLAGPYLLSLILMEQGQMEEAKKVALTEAYEILSIQAQALIAHTMGVRDSAEFFLGEIKHNYAEVAPYQIAQVYGHQNEIDSAFKWLDLAYEYRDGGLVQVQADPFMKSLRRDPRWKELMKKMQLTD